MVYAAFVKEDVPVMLWWGWMVGAVVVAVVVLRRELFDYVLDRLNPPETPWPPPRGE